MTASPARNATDLRLSLVDNLDRVFAISGRWKAGRKDLILALLAVALSDDNARLREKMRHGQVQRIVRCWLKC